MVPDGLLGVAEVGRRTGLTRKALRLYEELGLVEPAARTEAGYRLYGDADRQRLAFIRKARAIGLTLDEIRQLLALRREGEQPCGHLAELVDQKLAAVDAQLRALADFREELLRLRAEAATSTCDDGQVCTVIEQHQPIRADRDTPVSFVGTIARRR